MHNTSSNGFPLELKTLKGIEHTVVLTGLLMLFTQSIETERFLPTTQADCFSIEFLQTSDCTLARTRVVSEQFAETNEIIERSQSNNKQTNKQTMLLLRLLDWKNYQFNKHRNTETVLLLVVNSLFTASSRFPAYVFISTPLPVVYYYST